MNFYLILAVSMLAGFVGAGFVWLSWSAVENLLAARRSRPGDESSPNPND